MKGLYFATLLLVSALLAFPAAILFGWKPSDQWVTIWTGLFTGIAALTAGWWAWRAVQEQIRLQSTADDEKRRAKLRAEKATLPLVLLELQTICTNRIGELISRDPKWREGLWDIQPSHVKVLRACIQFSEAPARDQMIDLIAIWQICEARFEEHAKKNEESILPLFRASDAERVARAKVVFDWVSLKARLQNLVFFARDQDDQPKWERILPFSEEIVASLTETGSADGSPLLNDPSFRQAYEVAQREGRIGYSNQDWRKTGLDALKSWDSLPR